MAAFHTIGIIGRLKNEKVKETLRTLVNYLADLKRNVVIEAETAESLNDHHFKTYPREDIGNACDLLIVVGGDGSLLNAAQAAVESETPVLGINRGSLGFLTDIHPTQLTKIANILAGEYVLEKRFLLTASVSYDGKTIETGNALNEVTLLPDVSPHMIEFEIYIDDSFVCSQHSDGLILATPTGSTAYALSGGGPIVHPNLNAIIMVPMFPHTLSLRPIVVDGNSHIRVVVSPNNTNTIRISCDAQNYITAPAGANISITKKEKLLHLIHPLDYNYYESLRSKLHWGKKLQFSE